MPNYRIFTAINEMELLIFFCPFREAICELGCFFRFENEFLQCVVVKLRSCYEASVKSKARGYINFLSSHGTELGAIKEVS